MRIGFFRAGLMGLPVLATIACLAVLPGCLGSTFARHTIEVEEFQGWWGLDPIDFADPDSLLSSVVPITSQISSIADGKADGVSELTLFVQIQNAASLGVKAIIYAHQTEIFDIDELRARGLQITKPVLVGGQSAQRIDARNYPDLALNTETFLDLVMTGDFYLYVVGDSEPFLLRANAPALSMIVIE